MDTIRWGFITSDSTEFLINYGEKTARIRLENLVIPDDAGADWKVFYLERLTELFAAIQADGMYWTSRPSE